MKRRTFLQVATTVAAAGWLSPISAQGQKRKSVNAMDASSPDLQKYANAVGLMTKLPAADPRNWTAQATIHNSFCPHQNWWFLPWHRAYVHYLEEVCRDVLNDKTFCLPYWDWSRATTIPKPFLDKNSALYDKTRRNTVLDATEVALSRIQRLVGTSALTDVFSAATKTDNQREAAGQGELEYGPHNHVHSRIQGNMGTFMSPLDPIFWMHHCNIDRIWASWSRQSGHQPPTAGLWKNHKLTEFYDPATKQKISPQTDSTGNELAYGSVYDAYESPAALNLLGANLANFTLQASGEDLAAHIHRMAAASDMTQAVTAGATRRFQIPEDAAMAGIILKTASAAKDKPQDAAVYVYLDDVAPPADAATSLRVFLNSKTASSTADPGYLGTVNFFGSGHSAEGHSGSTFAINASRTIAAVQKAGLYNAKTPIEVSIVPVGSTGSVSALTSKSVQPGGVRLIAIEGM